VPISYVVTVFDKRPFLPAVLRAVAAEQAATGGEIILVDDGSRDGSAAMLAAFAAGNGAVRVVSQPNGGVAQATNRGIAAATGDWIRLLDGDDLAVPGSTARLRAALEGSGADLAYGAYALYHLGETPVAPGAIAGGWARIAQPLRQVLTNNEIVPSINLGRRIAMQAVLPLVETVRTAQDFQLAARLSQRGAVVRLDGAAVCWFAATAEGRLSGSVRHMYADTCRLVAAHLDGPFAWPAAEARFAVRRNASRAQRFAGRHLRLGWRQALRLRGLTLRARSPFYRPLACDLDFLAGLYEE
jgi:Glycosyl transferase family 2